MMAIVIDQLNALLCKGTKKRPPKPIKRPKALRDKNNGRHYGKTPIMASNFKDWFYKWAGENAK
ncbi:MAG: hypothetical protein LBI63_01760 [Candidatus Ancillula sp.]|jgi:hypothetical protein|nr:hypothetical protein [Candidatus Ancillula sp.]